MVPVSWETIRLFFHVLAATVWVGGQLTLAALVPALRRFGAEVPRAAARRFNQVAWIAFAVLIVTGIWNVTAVSSEISHSASYQGTLIVKLVVVGISGLTAVLHAPPGTEQLSQPSFLPKVMVNSCQLCGARASACRSWFSSSLKSLSGVSVMLRM
jgi:putative copper export protein